jgi:hypothetical protein
MLPLLLATSESYDHPSSINHGPTINSGPRDSYSILATSCNIPLFLKVLKLSKYKFGADFFRVLIELRA